jgi:DNA-binding transcriptional LysR family regulator
MSVNFQHLRSFLAVAADQNMTRAASRLNLSQSTLSKQIRSLEDRHGVRLFATSRPPLILTREGEELFERVHKLFELAGEIDESLGSGASDGGGLLRIGTDSPALAADLIARCRHQNVDLDFKVSVSNATGTNQLLMAAAIDLAIVCEPVGRNDYSYRPFFEDVLVAVVPAGLRDDFGDTFDLRQLERLTLLTREPASRTRATISQILEVEDIAPMRTMEVHTREMIRECVARGLGVSFMFASECPPDYRLGILSIACEPASARVSVYIACRNDRKRRPAIRRVLQIAEEMTALRQSCRSHPGVMTRSK